MSGISQIIPPKLLSESPAAFGVAISGGLMMKRGQVQYLRHAISGVVEDAERNRLLVDSSQWNELLAQSEVLNRERRWTIQDIQELRDAGDPRAAAISAPIIRLLLESRTHMLDMQSQWFPSQLWGSVVVSAMSEWELVLRGYIYYLNRLIGKSISIDDGATLKTIMNDFRRYIDTSPIEYPFGTSSSWSDMHLHRRTRNLIVHWGSRTVGVDGREVSRYARRRDSVLEVRDDTMILTEAYASCVLDVALGFIVEFDEAVREVI